MTTAPVPLAEQIAAVEQRIRQEQETIAYFEEVEATKDNSEIETLRAVLASLQHHERLVEALIRFRDDATGSNETLNALWDTLDAAANAGALNVK